MGIISSLGFERVLRFSAPLLGLSYGPLRTPLHSGSEH